MYEDGADGISTFNWYFHLHLAKMPNQWQAYYGYGMGGSRVQKYFLSILGDPKAIRKYRKQPWFWPDEPIRLSSGTHLFRDDCLFAESKGLTRTTHQPHKLAEPVPPSGEWDQRPSAPHWASYDALAAKELPAQARSSPITAKGALRRPRFQRARWC